MPGEDDSGAEVKTEKTAATVKTVIRSQVPHPGQLNLHSGNVAENWKRFQKQYEFYEVASGFDSKNSKVRVAALLSIIGEEATDLYSTFEWTYPTEKWDWDAVIKQFKDYCMPRTSVLFETYKFGKRHQEQGEGVDQYVTALRKLAENCDFRDKDRRIRDQLVLGMRDIKAQTEILREEDPKLTDVIAFIRSHEASVKQGNHMQQPDEIEQVSQIRNQKKRHHQRGPAKEQKSQQAEVKVQCKFCGREHEKKKEKCPAWNKKCNSCGKMNHFARLCKNKQDKSEIKDAYHICSVAEKEVAQKTITLTVIDTGAEVTYVIDTGAPFNVLPNRDYERITGDLDRKELIREKITIIAYGGKKWPTLGYTWITVKLNNNKKYRLKSWVVDVKAKPLLGLRSCEIMEVLTIHICDQEPEMTVPVNAVSEEGILQKYEDVFTGVGKLEGKYHITMRDDVKPVIHAPRTIPVALRDPVKKKLDELEAAEIITRVTTPTDWVSSMLIKKEKNKLRICLDPKDLNQAIKREHYPLPTFEQVTTRLGKAKVFSLLDAKSGFWHQELDEEGSFLTTFNTPFGRYRWLRMPFGICSAPEVWQRRMHELVEGLRGVEVIADDFLVVGCGDTQDEAERDHDRNLIALLERCRQRNLKLNREKMRLRLKELRYMGHVLTPGGVKMDPHKLEAIMKMPRPTDADAVRRFLGYVQYLAKFLPKLSEIAEPLRRLTNDGVKWEWKKQHEETYEKLKKLTTAAPVLAYYDLEKPVTIECDSSESGLGTSLLQEGRPVAFASRALTETERRYAQIEKEMLAIVYSCVRFDQYVYGRQVEVHSDHKPLEAIFKKPIWKSPKRLQRMLLVLQRYNLDVKFKKGSQMYIADTLSRAFLPNTATLSSIEEELTRDLEQVNSIDDLPDTVKGFEEIRDETKADAVLEKLRSYILKGWPEKRADVDRDCQPYFLAREELAVEDDLIFKGERVLIPTKLRKVIMEKIHSTHGGIEGCLRRAREHVYWPQMNAQLKEYVASCEICNQFRPDQQKEPMMSHEVPERPWSTVSTDIFKLKGVNYVVVVDHYSNFFEYARLTTETAAQVISVMKKIFATHGIPERVISDNGPQYRAEEFQKFARSWGFEHITSSPGYPQSNGRAENAVKICKSLMTKALEGKTDFFMTLLDWRNTPSASLGMSPVQRLYSRRTRTLMPTLPKKLDPEVQSGVKRKIEESREKQKSYYDRSARPLADLQQGDVIRMKLPGCEQWAKGIVVKGEGKRSYSVKVNGVVYRRNRRQLIAVHENPPEEEKPVAEEPQQPALRRSKRIQQRKGN